MKYIQHREIKLPKCKLKLLKYCSMHTYKIVFWDLTSLSKKFVQSVKIVPTSKQVSLDIFMSDIYIKLNQVKDKAVRQFPCHFKLKVNLKIKK